MTNEVEILDIKDPFEVPQDPSLVPPNIKKALAFNLRKVGVPVEIIAEKLNIKPGTARNYIADFIKEHQPMKDVEQVIDMELLRLDELQAVCWQTAKQGDMKAIETILRVMAQRMRLLGIGSEPTHGGGNVTTTNNVLVIGGSEEEYIKALKDAQRAAKSLGY